jgi:SAM-dependent methyltransferase
MVVLDRMAALVTPHLNASTLVVDLGCGPFLFLQRLLGHEGGNAGAAQDASIEVVGVDISEPHLVAAREVLEALLPAVHGKAVLGDLIRWE